MALRYQAWMNDLSISRYKIGGDDLEKKDSVWLCMYWHLGEAA